MLSSRQARRALFFVAWIACSGGVHAAGPGKVDYSRDVQPILSENCFFCHGPDAKQRKAGLRLDTSEGATRKRDGVAAVIPGDSKASELIARIESDDTQVRMPPTKSKRRLTDDQKNLLRRWIDEGAEYRAHWAFTRPQRWAMPLLPAWANAHNPIDAFIAARLDKEGLRTAAEAQPAKLLRRVALDLTGLPPTLEDLDAFLADKAPDAYERAVERLLASPRYGERMVWDWLDAARYADTNGYQGDPTRTMWYWRDWAIRAINANLPFDQFTIEQLAGDLLPSPSQEQQIATGFHRNHMLNGEGGRIAEESRIEYVQDRVEATGAVWLGLTFTCCRCHDHKYDPFSQKEYYRLAAYFNSIDESGATDAAGMANPVLSLASPPQQKELTRLRAAAEAVKKDRDAEENRLRNLQPQWEQEVLRGSTGTLPERVKALLAKALPQRSDAEKQEVTKFYLGQSKSLKDADAKLATARKAVTDLERSLPRTMVMRERPQPRDTFVLFRGAYDKPKDKVSHGVPAVLPPLPAGAANNRLALARWLVSSEQPLTPRVVVNRLWQQFFGTGLVKTAEDFGLQGERPSHPELLDWLARELVESGWDVKHLVRLIVTSHAYRQSSRVTPELVERDPANRLLARGPRHRLPSWMLRDQALFVSGLLAERMGGAPVKGYQPPGVWEEATFGFIRYAQDHGEALYRRSLYQFWRRIVAPTMFFDVASRQTCVVKVERTNTPLHALSLLNDVTYVEAARALAQRTLTTPGDDATRLSQAFCRCTGRPVAPDESALLLRRLQALRGKFRARPDEATKLLAVGESKPDPTLPREELAAWSALCSVLLNLDETICKE